MGNEQVQRLCGDKSTYLSAIVEAATWFVLKQKLEYDGVQCLAVQLLTYITARSADCWQMGELSAMQEWIVKRIDVCIDM